MGKRFRLLSIDGGGIRGIIPALVLAALEEKAGRPIHQLFDGICATSTGAIIALGLTRPGIGMGEPERLAGLYVKEGPKIFVENWRDRLGTIPQMFANWLGVSRGFDVNDLYRPRYYAKARRVMMDGYFGGMRMQDAVLPVLVTSYDTAMRVPVFFVTREEDDNYAHTYYEATSQATMAEAVMCATAAPSYFPPEVHKRAIGGAYSLIDGSIYAANPTAIGRSFLRPKDSLLHEDIIVSLGTGAMQQPYPFSEVLGWGLASWAGPALKMTIDGQAESAALAIQFEASGAYLRVQGLLDNATDDLDDVRPANLVAIQDVGKKMVQHFDADLTRLAQLLVDSE